MSKMSKLLIPGIQVDRAATLLRDPPLPLLAVTPSPTAQQLLRHALDVGLTALEAPPAKAGPAQEDPVDPGRVASFFFAAIDLPLALVPRLSLSGRSITYEASLALEHNVQGYDRLEVPTGAGSTPEAAIASLARSLVGLKVWTRSPPGGRYTDKLEWTIEAFPPLATQEDLERAMSEIP
jgi:hypothetical protein